jgi:hypothetical protein
MTTALLITSWFLLVNVMRFVCAELAIAIATAIIPIRVFIRYGFDTPKLASALFGFVKSYF